MEKLNSNWELLLHDESKLILFQRIYFVFEYFAQMANFLKTKFDKQNCQIHLKCRQFLVDLDQLIGIKFE